MAVSTIQLTGAPFDGAGAHNNAYRGKYLGSSVTADQWTAIGNGTFKDLYIGDYWTISNVNWRIAHFDYWYNFGDTVCETHHAVIVPDVKLYDAAMNDTATSSGAYAGSKMYSTNLNNARSTIKTLFGESHILSKRLFFENTASNGYSTAGAYYTSTVDLMNEINVCGCKFYGNDTNGTTMANHFTLDNTQFALFRLDRSRIRVGANYWLRDVAAANAFSGFGGEGVVAAIGASASIGVRPAFGICA